MEPDCRLSKYAEIFSGSRAGCRRVGARFRKLKNGDVMAVINTNLFVRAASIEAEASPRKFPIKGESFFGFQLDRIQLGMENGSAAQIYQIFSERILSHLLDALREAVGDLDLGPLPYLPAPSTASPEAAARDIFALALYGLGCSVFMRRDWILRPGFAAYSFLALAGVGMAVAFRWAYVAITPLTPGLDSAIFRDFPNIALPLLAARLTRWWLLRPRPVSPLAAVTPDAHPGPGLDRSGLGRLSGILAGRFF